MRSLVGVLLVALVLLLIGVGWSAYRHGPPLVAALSEVQAAVASAPAAPIPAFERAALQLRIARAEMDGLRWFAEPLAAIGERLSVVPGVGGWFEQAAASWFFADHALGSAVTLADAAEAGLQAARTGPQARGLVAAAPALSASLRQAEQQLALAQAAREKLHEPLPPFDRLHGQLVQWDSGLPRLQAALSDAVLMTDALPRLLGADRPVTYLVLAQTSDDLRATGGFITSVGTIQLNQGELAEYAFQKVYAAEGLGSSTDRPPVGIGVAPPRPLEAYMGARVLLLRDANWWADFPATARQARDLWQQVQSTEVHGVVAFTEAGLESALRVVGSVTVDGQTVTAQSLKDQTLERVFAGTTTEAEWYERQTTFSQQLASAILAAAVQLGPDQLVQALPALQQAFKQRDVLVTSLVPGPAAVFARMGVDGAVRGGQDDYLYLVEQNVSYGKVSPFIAQQVQYNVEVDASGRVHSARLMVDRTNTFQPERARPGYPDAYYWGLRWVPAASRLDGERGAYGGYTRLLLPSGSQILGASGFDDQPRADVEAGRTRLGGFTWLPMGVSRRLLAEWQPAGQPSVPGVYRLVVQRQPGAPVDRYTVQVTVRQNAQPTQIAPAPTRVDDATLTWTFDLDADREIVLDFRR